jgi:hypothetical protein
VSLASPFERSVADEVEAFGLRELSKPEDFSSFFCLICLRALKLVPGETFVVDFLGSEGVNRVVDTSLIKLLDGSEDRLSVRAELEEGPGVGWSPLDDPESELVVEVDDDAFGGDNVSAFVV